ncbi:sensor histidine kinase [Falsiroseomonas sp.]|uniref:sensor histidine kinase n=1 Tax=Falsiroseomonas sp. TaxID=2870721 RepID=UPI0035673A67
MNLDSDFHAERATLRSRLRQQRLVAGFGAEAFRARDFGELLRRAAEITAEGLGTDFAKVLEYIPREEALLIRTGVGWRDGVVGVVKLGADTASPAGYALKTGEPVITNHLAGEARFRTPAVMAEHGVRRAINVIIQGEEGGPAFGVLEADSRDPKGSFSADDVAFLQAVANILGLAFDRERDRTTRDLLMREVHHRVKNSLQLAQTVLNLQARASEAEAARGQLEEAARRIMTIAAVHERLYTGRHFGRVNIAGYLGQLTDDISTSSGAASAGRAIGLDLVPGGETAECDADRATTLGLVATELVTNALKYGEGRIVVRFDPGAEAGHMRLVVEDEGAGPPPGFDPALSRGLGMRLLVAMLRGALTIECSAAPTRCRFIADLPPEAH